MSCLCGEQPGLGLQNARGSLGSCRDMPARRGAGVGWHHHPDPQRLGRLGR